MRTNQASQSVTLAFVLVAALGFLGYTLLGEDAPRGQSRPPRPASATSVSVVPHAQAKPTAMQIVEIPIKQDAAAAGPTSAPHESAEHEASVIGAKTTPGASGLPPAAAAVAALAHTAPDAAPVLPVSAAVPPQTAAAKSVPRRQVPRPKRVAPAPQAPLVAARDSETKAITPVLAAKEVPGAKPAAAPIAAAPDAPASTSVSLPFLKEEMTVTISGEQAWVQVSPTRTMPARKGDVLPNLGKILEIRKNEVVAEKGTLTTN